MDEEQIKRRRRRGKTSRVRGERATVCVLCVPSSATKKRTTPEGEGSGSSRPPPGPCRVPPSLPPPTVEPRHHTTTRTHTFSVQHHTVSVRE